MSDETTPLAGLKGEDHGWRWWIIETEGEEAVVALDNKPEVAAGEARYLRQAVVPLDVFEIVVQQVSARVEENYDKLKRSRTADMREKWPLWLVGPTVDDYINRIKQELIGRGTDPEDAGGGSGPGRAQASDIGANRRS